MAAGGSSSAPGAIAPARLIRSRVGRRAVHLRVTVSGAGELVLYGWIGAGKKRANACVPARRRASTSGSTEITCKLTDPTLRRRARHRLRLHLKVDFLPASGTPQEVRGDLTLPRRRG